MKRTPVLTVLRRARKLIDKGWLQNQMQGKVGRRICFCAEGALRKVTTDYLLQEDAKRALQRDPKLRAYATRKGYSEIGVIGYNDAKGRTQAQVLAWFDRTIARLEQAA